MDAQRPRFSLAPLSSALFPSASTSFLLAFRPISTLHAMPGRRSKKCPKARFFALYILCPLALWTSFWAYFPQHLRETIQLWAENERNRGHVVSFEPGHASGWPFAVRIPLKNLHWQDGKGHQIDAPEASVSLHPWSWRTLNVLAANAGGQWSGAAFAIRKASVTVHTPLWPPKSHAEAGLTFSASLNGIELKTPSLMPLGKTVESLSLSFRVMGPLPDPVNKKTLAAWNNKNGIVECDAFEAVWGPLTVAMKGTVALTGNLQPEGAFAGRIAGLEKALDAFAEATCIGKPEAALASSFLKQTAQTPAASDESGLDTPITIQSGGLFIGPARVLTLPPIDWPQ